MSNTIKSIIKVALSNVIGIVGGIIVGFIVPKMMEVESYGYYKTFTLYSTYLSLCHLGIIDGIVLKYGGIDYDNLNKKVLRGTFKWYLLVHFFFTCVLLIVAVALPSTKLKFIVFALALNAVFLNVTGYYQQISQITQRFSELSFRKILQSVLTILLTLSLFLAFLNGVSVRYQHYISGVLLINAALSLWYIYTYQDLIFGNSCTLKETKKEVLSDITVGAPLLIANMCGTLILTLDRQFVSVLYDKATYAVYAFAYNMLSLVTVATSAISTVLYPALKRTQLEDIGKISNSLVSVILIFVFLGMIVYYPLCAFVLWFLPKYAESLPIFRIIFPGLAISSAITVVMHNIYKAIGKNNMFFKKSIITLFVSFLANVLAYSLFKTTTSISIASVITMAMWYAIVEKDLVVIYSTNPWRNRVYLALMVIAFYLASSFSSILIGGIVYLFAALTTTLIIFWRERTKIINALSK